MDFVVIPPSRLLRLVGKRIWEKDILDAGPIPTMIRSLTLTLGYVRPADYKYHALWLSCSSLPPHCCSFRSRRVGARRTVTPSVPLGGGSCRPVRPRNLAAVQLRRCSSTPSHCE